MPRCFASLAVAALIALAAPAQADEINTGLLDDVAIQGYDAMAYWTKGEPIEGEDTYEVEWKDATWRFDSQEEAAAFAADPERYAPLYGGHCANAMSLNKKVRADATIWRIYGDYLALFAAERGRTRWDENDWEQLKATADANWEELRDE
jgi:hypothetical protein